MSSASGRPEPLLIAGVLAQASNGGTFPNVNPATEQIIGVTADAVVAQEEIFGPVLVVLALAVAERDRYRPGERRGGVRGVPGDQGDRAGGLTAADGSRTMAEEELAGARVLVTGASAGIGRAVAVRAVRQGARVMLAARRRKELEAACAEAGGGEPAVVDLAERAGCNRLTEAVRSSFGGLDLVISCVGVAPLQMMADTGDEHWEQVLTTNVVSTHRLLRGCVPLLGRDGTFIALSSDSVQRPRSGLGAYATSKAALERLVHGWRIEHPWLRFTTVTVGDTFPTDFGNAFDGEVLTRVLDEWAARGLAQARFMTPDDVARTLLAVAGTMRALPGIGVDHLVIRSPSPPAASFMEAFAALAGAPGPAPAQGEIDG